jgi:hypothetical protein
MALVEAAINQLQNTNEEAKMNKDEVKPVNLLLERRKFWEQMFEEPKNVKIFEPIAPLLFALPMWECEYLPQKWEFDAIRKTSEALAVELEFWCRLDGSNPIRDLLLSHPAITAAHGEILKRYLAQQDLVIETYDERIDRLNFNKKLKTEVAPDNINANADLEAAIGQTANSELEAHIADVRFKTQIAESQKQTEMQIENRELGKRKRAEEEELTMV